jgi:predicted negative regulator of RcsB-dependent stress response
MDRDRKDNKDRERLVEGVHQTDLTENRVNEDFVDFLKSKGPTWLLIIVVAVAAYLFMVQWKTRQFNKRNDAWAAVAALDQRARPSEWVDVANDFGTTDGIGIIARLNAADRYLGSVQVGQSLDTGGVASSIVPLSNEERTKNIGEAITLYDQVIAADKGEPGQAVFTVNAMFGRATMAECQGDAAAAREWYEKARERAAATMPRMVQIAEDRIANVDAVCAGVTLHTERPDPTLPQLKPVLLDPSLRAIIEGSSSDSNG